MKNDSQRQFFNLCSQARSLSGQKVISTLAFFDKGCWIMRLGGYTLAPIKHLKNASDEILMEK